MYVCVCMGIVIDKGYQHSVKDKAVIDSGYRLGESMWVWAYVWMKGVVRV